MADGDDEKGFAREPEVLRRTGLDRVTRYRMAKAGAFPKAVPLTPDGRRKGVPRRLLAAWERAREAAAGGAMDETFEAQLKEEAGVDLAEAAVIVFAPKGRTLLRIPANMQEGDELPDHALWAAALFTRYREDAAWRDELKDWFGAYLLAAAVPPLPEDEG